LYTQAGTINAVHAGARVKKLLQLVSGGVYDEDGNVQYLHQERYDIVMQLVSTRAHSIVAFNWKHERDALIALAEKQNITYDLIDGSVPAHKRSDIVERFKQAKYKYCFVIHNLQVMALHLQKLPLLFGVHLHTTQNTFNSLINAYIDLDKKKKQKLFLLQHIKPGKKTCTPN